MHFKADVNLKPFFGLPHVIHCVDKAFMCVLGHEALMTSANDSKHMKGSLHFKNRAWDFRIAQQNDTALGLYSVDVCDDLVDDLQNRLGDEYQVLLEYEKLHIHVEFDPIV